MSIPPSSPRLPSPPPPTEDQIGPPSPALGSSNAEPSLEQSVIDANATRRIHPGTKAADMAAGPPLVPLGELDSAFQLQEHLKALHHHHTKSETSDNTVPITRESASLIAAQPEGVDRSLWLYELCRFLINKCNDLIIGFLFDDPPCSATTCPEMRASEWQFLCAVHEVPKSCCAIDYCCHTLDWATNIVTSQKIFPSRLTLEGGSTVDSRGSGEKHLTNIFRRLHRIFAHAWFQHRGVFWQVEGQNGLYVFFKTVCDTYDLLPPEAYKLPPEAEGLESIADSKQPSPAILRSNRSGLSSHHSRLGATEEELLNVASTNTRRHIRGSPSVGTAVTTVMEADDEDPDVTQKLESLEINDDDGVVNIPVVVETYSVDEDEEKAKQPTADETKPIENESNAETEDIAESIEDARPKTAYLDKGFNEILDVQDEGSKIDNEVELSNSPDAETPVVQTKDGAEALSEEKEATTEGATDKS